LAYDVTGEAYGHVLADVAMMMANEAVLTCYTDVAMMTSPHATDNMLQNGSKIRKPFHFNCSPYKLQQQPIHFSTTHKFQPQS
jgi:hypothetical protein